MTNYNTEDQKNDYISGNVIVDPYVATFVTMDDISRKLSQLLNQNSQLIKQIAENQSNSHNQSTNQNKLLIEQYKEDHRQILKQSENFTQLLKEDRENRNHILERIDKQIINNIPKLIEDQTDTKNIKNGISNLSKNIDKRYIEMTGAFNKLLEITYDNQKLLSSILGELKAEADEGQFLRISGTVTTTEFTIINTDLAPGHMVKSYTVKNDGSNDIFVGHNIAVSSDVDADIVDVTTSVSRFNQVLPNEDIKFVFNRKNIKNVHILASGGNSTFRAWLAW